MKVISFVKGLWEYPSHVELMQTELKEAQRELLVAESTKELATSLVEYNVKRIARIKAKLRDEQE